MVATIPAAVGAIPNLLGFWKLGEASGTTVADSSGNGNTLTLNGTVTLGSTALAAGDTATSALFNGTSGYAVAASSSVLSFDYTQPFSVAAIINVTSVPGSGTEGFIIGKEVSGGNFNGWNFGIIGKGSSQFGLEFLLVKSIGVEIYVKGSTAMSAGTHVVGVSYDGSGLAAGVTLWVDGIPDQSATIANNSLAGNTIINVASLAIGVRGGGTGTRDSFFPGKIQYVALFGASAPNGTDGTHAAYPQKYGYDVILSSYACLALFSAASAPVNPVTPNWWLDNDPDLDPDDLLDIHVACALAAQGKGTIIGASVCSSGTDGASVFQAIFDYWGVTAPVFAYQGNDLASTTLYATSVANQFEVGDTTNKGVTAVAIVGGGTGNVVGDVLPIPGGTTAAKRGRAATLTVSAVSAGVITAFSISNSGSYSTVPSGTITLPNLHGGTAATVTLTTTIRRGNYTNPLSGMRAILAASSNVYILAGGGAKNLAVLLASASNAGGDGLGTGASIITSSVVALVWSAGYMTNSAAPGVEYNLSQIPAEANALVSGSPVWPTPIVINGIENAWVGTVPGLINVKPDSSSRMVNPAAYGFNLYAANGGTDLDGSGKRIFFSALSFLWAAEGLSGGRVSWGLNGATMTINASTGANATTYAAGTPPIWALRKTASDAALTAWAQALVNASPATLFAPSVEFADRYYRDRAIQTAEAENVPNLNLRLRIQTPSGSYFQSIPPIATSPPNRTGREPIEDYPVNLNLAMRLVTSQDAYSVVPPPVPYPGMLAQRNTPIYQVEEETVSHISMLVRRAKFPVVAPASNVSFFPVVIMA